MKAVCTADSVSVLTEIQISSRSAGAEQEKTEVAASRTEPNNRNGEREPRKARGTTVQGSDGPRGPGPQIMG